MEANSTDHHYDAESRADFERRRRKERWRSLLSIAQFVGTVALLVVVIQVFGIKSYQVFGQSMSPTLEPNDRLIITKFARNLALVTDGEYTPKRGDIIVFVSPQDNQTQLIKRVIALEGERVQVSNGEITVYNEANPQGFNPDSSYNDEFVSTSGEGELVVPDGHVYVSGDNRSPGGSLDSRNNLGTIDVGLIEGKLRLRFYPFSEFRTF